MDTPGALYGCPEMQVKTMFPHTINRIFEPEDDVVVGYEIKTDPITDEQGILQIIIQFRHWIHIIHETHIKEGIQVKCIVNPAEFFRSYKVYFKLPFRKQSELEVIFEYSEILPVHNIIFIPPDNVAAISDRPFHIKWLLLIV